MDGKPGSNYEQGAAIPYFRIWLCGALRVEWLTDRSSGIYQSVRTADWGGSSYPRLLLKALLCCPGRQARREALIEMIWPEVETEQAAHNLNTATTKLRKVLQMKGQESLLITEDDATIYFLPNQTTLWVDTNAALALLKDAERIGRSTTEAVPLLEEAANYFNRGTFLEGEEGLWASGKRATLSQARYRCLIWLAEAFIEQRMPGLAETVFSMLLGEDPTDEDVLSQLMNLLHRQGMIHQALQVYKQACETFAQEGIEPAKATRRLALRLEEERHYPLQERMDSVPLRSNAIDLPSYTLPLFTPAVGTSPHSIFMLPSTALPSVNRIGIGLLDCAACFGIRLAQMMTLIQQWYGMASFCKVLQDRLVVEIKQLDQMKTQFPLEEYMLSRRNMLAALAALPASLMASVRLNHKKILALEEFLPTCAASITACWSLSGGSRGQLDVIVPLLNSYLPVLLSICQHTPAYREVAADLVAQVYFLKAILSWHMEGLEPAEAYCIQAMKYSDLTKNINLRLTGLNQHALIAFYNQDFQKALAKSEEADAVLRRASHEHIFPIIEGRVCMYLAAIQAQQQVKDAEFTLERAQAAFAAQAALVESVPVYADCGDAPLLLWEGLTHYYLSPRSVEHAKRSFDSLSTFGQLASSATIPERFRLECLNSRILAAIQLGELEETIACFEAGQQGAKALESKQRSTEVDYAYQLLYNRWAREERVKKLRSQAV